MGPTPYRFPVCKWWKLDQLFIQRHHHNNLKLTKLCLGPIEMFLWMSAGFLIVTKMKGETQLNVMSSPPSRGDFRQATAATVGLWTR